jgi:hypothetical protein
MDYDKIINSTYTWFSLKKVIWFLVFFWLAIPILFVVPWAIEKQYFNDSMSWIVYILYCLIYIAIMIGFVSLTCACLKHKKLKYSEPTNHQFIDTIILAFFELWFIFIWNIHKSYRFTQLLLLIGTPLLYVYYMFNPTIVILVSLIIFAMIYLLFVIHNSIRLFFTVTIFYNKNLTKEDAIKESWNLTNGRFILSFFSIILVLGVVFILFALIAIILGAIANILLLSKFTPAVAYQVAQSIAIIFALGPAIISYYFGVIEVYDQLEKEQTSANRVKRILARRVLSPKKKITKKKVVKKKSSKKKVVKKKIKKKKSVKKKIKKKTKKK